MKFIFKKLIFVGLFSSLSFGAITGKAYRDYNADGVQQGGEPGVSNVVVKAYVNDSNGKDSFLAETTTGIDGSYSLDISADKYPIRLEFSLPTNACNVAKDVEFPSAGGSNYGTSVQFIKKDGEIHNFALSYPYDFSTQANPYVFLPIIVAGNPLGQGTTADTAGLVKFHFNASGHAPNSGSGRTADGEKWVELAKQNQIGTTLGLAYSRQARKIFVAANLRRHAGLGVLGSGGIYMLNPDKTSDQQAGINFLNLDNIGIATQGSGDYTNALDGSDKVKFSPVIGSNSDRGLKDDKSQPSNDSAAYGQVGKLGLGDLDISENGQYLYVVNLYDRKLYEININDPKNPVAPDSTNVDTKVKGYAIPNVCDYSDKAGEYRPFALKIYKNKAYVGITCSGQDSEGNTIASSASDMKGFIYSLDLSDHTTWKKEIEWNFDYRSNDGSGYPWHPWTNTWQGDWEYGIPLIGDIEFDNHGSMLVGVLDLHGHQLAYNNYKLSGTDTKSAASTGDLLRFTKTQTCSYNVDLSKEYYDDNLKHKESSIPMLAGHHTSDKDLVLATFMDPIDIWSEGVVLYDNTTGKRVHGYEVVYGKNPLTYTGKANGLGDIETMEFVPPVEVGNLVWVDKDKDGVQDANEPGVAGVKLILSEGSDCSNPIANTTTDANGNYIFNYANVNPKSDNPGLQANTQYTICIDSSQFTDNMGIEGTELEGMYLTASDINGTSDNPDKTDSDAKADVEGKAYITFTTDGPGQNNHSFDFGFIKTVCIGDRIWRDDNNNGIQDDSEVNVDEEVKVTLLDESGNSIKNYVGTDVAPITTTTGEYKFCNLDPKKYIVQFEFPDGYVVSPKKKGDDDSIDNDVNSNSNQTDILNVQDYNFKVDLGLFKPACIGDLVWHDVNGNGIKEDSESGIKNAKVELFDTQDNLINSKITSDDGAYKFCNLIPGDYYVKVTPPADYILSPKDQGADDKDSDIDPHTLKSEVTNLEPGEKDMSFDAGVYKPACIGNYTWLDKDADGIQNDNAPLSGVEVTLLDIDGNVVTKGADGSDYTNPLTTNSNGEYHFCNLKPGTYKVKFTKAHDANGAPYLSTKENVGDDSKDSDVNQFLDAKNGLISSEVSVKSEDDNKTVDAGFIQEVCVGDSVWEDMNANGIKESGEPAISGVNVNLQMQDENGNWIPAKTVQGDNVEDNTTNSNGNYKFCHLQPAKTYKITFDSPGSNYYITYKDKGDDSKDSDINSKREIVVTPVKDDLTLDAGFFRPACIGDFVWEDINANGIKEDGEPAISGVSVKVLNRDGSTVTDADGNTVGAITTGSDGIYHQCKLIPGDYKVEFTAQDGYYVTRKDSTDDSNDSDIGDEFATKAGTTVPTTLVSGEDDRTWDAGFFKPACIGDFIWEDSNANGRQDTNESGKDDVKITLVPLADEFGNTNSVDVNGDTLSSRAIIHTSNGNYKYCNLIPGKYKIKVEIPNGYVATRENVTANSTNDANDSDMGEFLDRGEVEMPAEVLTSGEDNSTLDGGIFKPGCIGSYVWQDKNANGIKDPDEDGIKDVNVTLIPLQDDYGYTNTIDANNSNVDHKMIQTDANGKYEFCELIPGKYKLRFDAGTDENGAPYITTRRNQGSDDKDSDTPEYQTGAVDSPEVTLGGNKMNIPNLYSGYIQKICLGNKVWFDENLNGKMDNNELGVRDLKVYLTYADGSSVKDVYGNPVYMTETNSTGEYEFCDLYPARDYKIKATIPESYHTTIKDKGSDTTDSDANRDGEIVVVNPVVDDYNQDIGVYCDCDDYLVHPDEHKEMSASALNILGLIAMLAAMFVIVRKED